MSGEHRTSYPMGNIHHGTPERPDWGPFCVECKESWPCEASELIAERDALAAKVARVEALADEWDAEGDDLIRNCYSGRDVNEGDQIKSCARGLRAALGSQQ